MYIYIYIGLNRSPIRYQRAALLVVRSSRS
jgi:hypothetical protein